MPEPGKPSPNESLKEKSRYLRGTLKESLAQDTTHFTNDENQLLKFHGSYQQDDRDKRQERLKEKKEPDYFMMVRSKIPGGHMSAEQYLAHDELSCRWGNQTLRITSRQGIQFHGVLKKNLKSVIRGIHEKMGTTSGACGDIVRNVMACPAPFRGRRQIEILQYAKKVSDQFLSKSGAYYEIWINGESVNTQQSSSLPPKEDPVEPLYGKTYLPRKFKIGFAFPEDNCIDVYTHDLGIVPELEKSGAPDEAALRGFNILVGGGFGMTHGVPTTYPRLASPFCFVKPDEILDITKAIVRVQRDFGNRVDRKRARMKYLIDEKGLDWFREEVEKRFGKKTELSHDIRWNGIETHLGWNEEGNGRWFFGISVENGRIIDQGNFRLKSALKAAVEKFRPEIHLTAQQDILLSGFQEAQQRELEDLLVSFGVKLPPQISNVQKDSMACPALPTCGLAITDSERSFPSVIDEFEAVLSRLGLSDQKIVVRMTGCPNGCARPYNSEIGYVGRTVGTYAVYLGGNLLGTRLNKLFCDKVPVKDLVHCVLPVLEIYKAEKRPKEAFGDFCERFGIENLKKAIKGPHDKSIS
ncbi:MAG: NADPH-dependent assimilatory sulfite reductase hemoprotein subunit [Candidatus Omnitrophica bacterium]|nr:NADPH-dependent assimilatory sulfite reductase hemoprotein subunit [Candidatus Omnitrophota bacterium]